METLWEIAAEGSIVFEDVVLENSSQKLSKFTPTETLTNDEETKFYASVTCQESSKICIFCKECIQHHKNHKFYKLGYENTDNKCLCCENKHACSEVNFCDQIQIIDCPDPETGETPIYIAAKNNHYNFIRKLINMKCNINALNTVKNNRNN